MEEDQKRLEEGLKDRGVSSRDMSTDDLESHASSHRMLIGLRLPNRPKRPKKSRRSKDKSGVAVTVSDFNSQQATQSPTETIQTLITEVDDEQHAPHSLFCQLDLLYSFGAEKQWREYARWVKYEEDLEEGGERWSKPHVASLSLHALFELRSTILNGVVILDLDAYHIAQVADMALDHIINNKMLEEDLRDDVKKVIISTHVFAHQKRKRSLMPGSASDTKLRKSFSKEFHFSDLFHHHHHHHDHSHNNNHNDPHHSASANQLTVPGSDAKLLGTEQMNGGIKESASSTKLNVDFMRKVPDDAQACNVMVGELAGLKYQIAAFVRLSEARNIGDLVEIPVPTRFVFLLLGPPGSEAKNIEIGRSMATVMVDEIYREVAYKARNRQEILTGLDEFLDQVTVLPPGEWDPKIRIEPPEKVPSQEQRKLQKVPTAPGPHTLAVQEVAHESHADPTLVRTGRLFGGLIADIKRKVPWYWSDFKDAFHIQCVASTIFLFLATLTPNVTFGGLLGQATDQYMGTMECILAAAIVGILFALFSGQPLNILGSTGPMLVLEMILYNFCRDAGWDFLPMRCWIGLWTSFLILLVVAFDLSALVRYITRFTEESFACLIALIFIYESFKKQFAIIKQYGVNPNPTVPISDECYCQPANESATNVTVTLGQFSTTMANVVSGGIYTYVGNNVTNMTDMTHDEFNKTACLENNGTLVGAGCYAPKYYPDVFFLSCLLFIGTYMLAMNLKAFRNSGYFPTFVRQIVSDFAVLISIIVMVAIDILIGIETPKLEVPDKFQVRQMVSDFAVLISIIVMVGLDMLIGINTPKLEVPSKFQPTRVQDRGWFINPVSPKNPWWLCIAAVVPAFLALVLIFMDQQITAVIVNRKENKLVKGNGYHLDMLVVAVCISICSVLGLPWYVAATVSAIAHIMSLKKESETAAPGEKPVFLGCREQRVTALLVGILSGFAVLLTGVLKMIPMPVLYGVFLYMGVAALKGMQFIDRLALLFMPAKYQPDHSYLRHVRINRVHIFTAIQIFCLAVLWVIKTVKAVSIAFPVMVVGTCFVRKAMDKFFTQYELSYLDDIMPGEDINAEEDAQKEKIKKENDEKRAKLLKEQEFLDDNEKDEREIMMDMKMKHTLGDKYGGYQAVPQTDRVNISDEMAKTGIWMQVRRDSVPVLENMNGSNSTKFRHDQELHHTHHHRPKNDGHRHHHKLAKRKHGSKASFTLGDDDIPEDDRESKI